MKRLVERARVLSTLRAFFDERGFLEVETPILVPSPGLDLHLDAFEIAAAGHERAEGAREAPRFLSTSPEYQMKRLLADGYERIYQITRAFRRGELGARHNPEFSILEWYRSNAGMNDVLADTEALIERVTGGQIAIGGRTVTARAPFARMTVCDAYRDFAGIAPDETLRLAAEDEDRFFRVLVDVVEPAIARLPHALALVDYPASQASLARRKPGDPRVAERFEVYLAGVELCNGFGELTDPVEQRARLAADQAARAARGLPVYPVDERFLAALERGVPPSGGNALGIDRLVALACGTFEIGEVMAFTANEL
jgi:lysyl-tRNA synthetase class 2